MIANKLTLGLIYQTLYRIEQNMGPIIEIRLANSSALNRKSYILGSLAELKNLYNSIKFISNIESGCDCFLGEDESIYTLVSVSLNLRDISNQKRPSTVFIDTAISLSTAKTIPSAHAQDLDNLRELTAKIESWSKRATCYAYIDQASEYLQGNPCYVEAVQNKSYKLLTQAYKKYVKQHVI